MPCHKLRLIFALLLALLPGCGGPAQAAPSPLPPRGTVEVAAHPLEYPGAVIVAAMEHDVILRDELMRLGHGLKFVRLGRQKGGRKLVGAAIAGDGDLIRMATITEFCVVGLAKKGFTPVVGRRVVMPAQLKGKRIAYAEGASAQRTLLQALTGAGLTERDVSAVPMSPDAMPRALAGGRIDAFVAAEPAPTIALGSDAEFRVLFRGEASDFFVLSKVLVRSDTDAALALSAGFARALKWMRRSPANLRQALLWAEKERYAASGVPGRVRLSELEEIVRREILDIPGAPVVAKQPGKGSPLADAFKMMRSQGRIPAAADVRLLERAFAYDGLQRVYSSPRRYRLGEFDYRP